LSRRFIQLRLGRRIQTATELWNNRIISEIPARLPRRRRLTMPAPRLMAADIVHRRRAHIQRDVLVARWEVHTAVRMAVEIRHLAATTAEIINRLSL
jgi:hypothetical protein